MKKKWKKPELIVLHKGTPQEAILTFCKSVALPGEPNIEAVGNNCGNDKLGSCQNCQSRGQQS